MKIKRMAPKLDLKTGNDNSANNKIRVCAYCRVSSLLDGQKNSLQIQNEYFEKKITANKNWINKGVYCDEGISGTKKGRPNLNKILKLAEDKEIDLVLTKSISRLGRNTVDLLEIVRRLKELNVEIIFEKENISSLSKDGELLLSILSSFAQAESKSISDNIRWNIRKKFENGVPIKISTKYFLGFDKNSEGNLVINEPEAEIVRRIFSEFISGRKNCEIYRGLNADNIKTPKGKEWRDGAVIRVLKNEKYAGDTMLQKTFVESHLTHKVIENKGELPKGYLENTHPAIIERDIWELAQTKLLKKCKGW